MAMIPRSLPITPEILRLIAELDEFKGRWSALQAPSPERLSSLRNIATIESVRSSTRIEGARLTDLQVEAQRLARKRSWSSAIQEQPLDSG